MRIFKILFIILLLVTVTEIGFYLFITIVKPPTNIQKQSASTSTSNSTPTVIQISTRPDNQTITENDLFSDNILSQLQPIEFIKLYKQNNNQNIYVVLEQTSIIKNIRVLDEKNTIVTLADDQGNKVVDITLHPSLNIVYNATKDGKIPSSLNDLKIGNKVIFSIKSDILNQGKNVEELIII